MQRRGVLGDKPDSAPKSLSTSKAADAASTRWRDLTDRVQKSGSPNSRPRDAATLLVLERSGGQPRLLMGKRHDTMKFMPGKFVFPGGRVEPQDYTATVGCEMPPAMTAKLLRGVRRGDHRQRAFAIAHAALRETQEETGIVIGGGANLTRGAASVPPDFSGFAFLARAITPARMNRRFDTRFFAVSADRISATTPIVDAEFAAVEWFTLEEARQQDLPDITRIVLDDLEERIEGGTLDDPEAAVPFYFMRGAYFHRKML